ncbi:response regulator [Geopsychrobacter electrodiphilus]|uniref:response regulator n=1 Tax=Geopsychrobacter electrodiphilus TaxID=225196 RepID=UPI000368B564|nr:response regulator [Geopsychrobacter electrodiphilus]
MMSAALITVPKRRFKILLVDDVELFVELQKTFFSREQFHIFTASNGVEALRLVTAEKPDLVFLDLYMSGMNGDEVCRRIKANPETANVPVVMVVQQGSSGDIDLCRAVCCDDILYKPVRRDDFIRASRTQLSLVERLTPRFTVRLLVHFGLRQERLFQQYTVNAGVGGLFLASEAHLSIDTWLSVKMEIPDGHPPLSCRGRVAWVNHPDWMKKPNLPHGMGVEFVDISPEQQQRLATYFAQSDVTFE